MTEPGPGPRPGSPVPPDPDATEHPAEAAGPGQGRGSSDPFGWPSTGSSQPSVPSADRPESTPSGWRDSYPAALPNPWAPRPAEEGAAGPSASPWASADPVAPSPGFDQIGHTPTDRDEWSQAQVSGPAQLPGEGAPGVWGQQPLGQPPPQPAGQPPQQPGWQSDTPEFSGVQRPVHVWAPVQPTGVGDQPYPFSGQGGASLYAPADAPPTREERTWASAAHWLGLLTMWVGPLVVLLTVGRRSERVRQEALSSLNWEITMALLLALGVFVSQWGILGPALAIAVLILSAGLHIIGAVVAHRGGSFSYPLALPIVR